MKAYKNSCPSALRKRHPQQNVYKFGDVKISSNFDTGNISDVTQVSDYNYMMTVAPDVAHNSVLPSQFKPYIDDSNK